MLAHHLRRWANIETALSEYPVFAGSRRGAVVVELVIRVLMPLLQPVMGVGPLFSIKVVVRESVVYILCSSSGTGPLNPCT